jgi:hypothetical protein
MSMPPCRSRLLESERWAFALSLISAAVSGCADDAGSDAPPHESLPVLSGCESESYEVCDPLDPDCQASVFATVKCLRRMPDGVLPELRVLTQAERRAELLEQLAPEPDDVMQSDVMERALGMLGLAQPDDFSTEGAVELLTNTVPAYYSNDTGAVTLVQAEGAPSNPAQLTLTLAHEFAHALQDQDVGLASVYRDASTFDAYLAVMSQIEGEAEMLESFFAAALWGLDDNPDFRQRYTSWIDGAELDYGDSSPFLVSQRYFPYSYGARFVYNVYAEGGMDAVRARLTESPSSVLPILLSVDHLEEPPLESLDERAAPAALDGFELVGADRFGPWILSKFLERGLFYAAPQDVVEAWRGDRFFVYAAPGGAVAALWTLRFRDSAAAERLLDELDDGRNVKNASGRAFVSLAERELTLGVVEDTASLVAWSETAAEAERVWRETPAAARVPTTPSPRVAPRLRRGFFAQLARRALRLP